MKARSKAAQSARPVPVFSSRIPCLCSLRRRCRQRKGCLDQVWVEQLFAPQSRGCRLRLRGRGETTVCFTCTRRGAVWGGGANRKGQPERTVVERPSQTPLNEVDKRTAQPSDTGGGEAAGGCKLSALS